MESEQIEIINRKGKKGVVVFDFDMGRGPFGSTTGRPLANENVIGRHGNRDVCCTAFELRFNRQLAEKDPALLAALREIYAVIGAKGKVILACWCKPERCHVDTIKEFLLRPDAAELIEFDKV